MMENGKIERKQGEKKPTAFRIDNETADRLRAICKSFPNQDVALNSIMAAYEREIMAAALPEHGETIRQFEQYQKCLSTKFTDVLKDLTTAEERAQIEVKNLLASKDLTIEDLQEKVEHSRRSRETYEKMYGEAEKEKKELEKKLETENLANQGLRAEIIEKEAKMKDTLQDKIQLNEILAKTLQEKEKEIEKLKKYAEMIEEAETKIDKLSGKVRELEDKGKEIEYAHRLELLEKDKQIEVEKGELRREYEEKENTIREKYEKELEKLREKNEAIQSRVQELMAQR